MACDLLPLSGLALRLGLIVCWSVGIRESVTIFIEEHTVLTWHTSHPSSSVMATSLKVKTRTPELFPSGNTTSVVHVVVGGTGGMSVGFYP